MNEFSASGSIKAGWKTFKKRPGFFIGSMLIIFVVVGIVSAIFGQYENQGTVSVLASLGNLLVETLVDIGIVAFALKAVDHPESVRLTDLWHPQHYFQYLVAVVLTGIAVIVGLVLLIVPGIIVMLMLLFVKYAVVDKNLGPIEALKESARITKGHRIDLLVLLSLALLVNIAGALCVLIGLLVSVPVTYLSMVHAYRTLQKLAPANA